MKKILSFLLPLLLVFALLLSACAPAPTPAPTPTPTPTPTPEPDPGTEPGEDPEPGPSPEPVVPPFDTVFRLVVMSDVHVSGSTTTGVATGGTRVTNVMHEMYKAFENEEYTGIDALVSTGDQTSHGHDFEYADFKNGVKTALQDETKFLAVMGNHEYDNGSHAETDTVYQERFMTEFASTLDWHETIYGYHLIGLSIRNNLGVFDDDQLAWLSAELAKAAADKPDQPIFVFQHHPIYDTTYFSSQNTYYYTPQSEAFATILAAYPQVIDCSGHVHAPNNSLNAVMQKDFTAVTLGSLAETRGWPLENTSLTMKGHTGSNCFVIEVNSDNVVRLRPYSLTYKSFHVDPRAGHEGEPLIYTVDPSEGKSGFLYTAARRENATAPAFSATAKATVSGLTYDTVNETLKGTLTFPQAKDNDQVYSYRLDFLTDGASGAPAKTSFGIVAYSWQIPVPATRSFTDFSTLKPDTDYRVEIYAYNIWGLVSAEPLVVNIHTPAVPEEIPEAA